MVTTSHKELLPLIFTIVEEKNEDDAAPVEMAAPAAGAAATAAPNTTAASATTSAAASPDMTPLPLSTSQHGIGIESSFRRLLPTSTHNGPIATQKSFSAAAEGGSFTYHRGRYNTKFSYKEWIKAHKAPQQQEQQTSNPTVPESLSLKLPIKPSKESQKEEEDTLKAINTYLEVPCICYGIVWQFILHI